MPSPEVTYFLVPGAFHTPVFYEPLIRNLKSQGYASTVIDLPSVDSYPPKPDFSADVEAIRNGVSTLVDQGIDVVVVLYSYSGLPGTEALKGLGKSEREEEGKSGGVIRLVYLTAYAPVEGFRPFDTDEEAKPFPMAYVENGNWFLKASMIHEMVHNGLSPAESAKWAQHFRSQSPLVFQTRTTYASWRKIPVTYLLCENDRGMPLSVQENMVQKMRDEGAKVDVVRCGAGHSPFLSHTELTAEVLIKSAAGRFR